MEDPTHTPLDDDENMKEYDCTESVEIDEPNQVFVNEQDLNL